MKTPIRLMLAGILSLAPVRGETDSMRQAGIEKTAGLSASGPSDRGLRRTHHEISGRLVLW